MKIQNEFSAIVRARVATPTSRAVIAGIALIAVVGFLLGRPEEALASDVTRPNVVFIFADDKYESAGPKAEKHAKNQLKTGFCARF